MKILKKCSSFFVLFLFTITAFTQSESTILANTIDIDNLSHWGAEESWKTRGVQLKSSYTGDGSVTVIMKGTNTSSIEYRCTSAAVANVKSSFPAEMILYQTTVSGANAGTVDEGKGIDGTVYNSLIMVPWAVFRDPTCTQTRVTTSFNSNIKTNQEIYYKRNIRTYYMVTKGWVGFHRLSRGTFPAKVEIYLTGDITLEDIDKIVLPGKTLLPTDFNNLYPISKGNNTANLRITNVNVSLEKNVSPFVYTKTVDGLSTNYHYDGSYDDVWLSNKPIPPYSTIPQKPYRIPILKHASNDNGGYAYFGEDNQIEVYATNSTEIENLNLNITIDVHNRVGILGLSEGEFSYAVWIDYNKPNGIYNMNETSISLPTTSSTNNTQSERVKSGRLSSGTQLVLENIPIPTNAFSGFNFSQEGQSKRTRLRIAIKKGASPPTVNEIFDVGEVHDYDIVFKPSICSSGTEIPYDYLSYAQKELSYCDYVAIRNNKEASYNKETTSNLIAKGRFFKVGVQKAIPYALSKHTKAGYDSHLVAFYDMLINSSTENAIPFDELDTDGLVDLVSGGDGEMEHKPAHPQAIGVRKLDPLNYPGYKGVTFVEPVSDMKDPRNMQDLPLYVDVYYPVPKSNQTMASLEALPLAIWMPGGGFMWNQGRSYVKTVKPATWLASQGFIVVVPDYRQGFYMQQYLVLRSMIRGWMDMNTAVKWWKSSGYDKGYLDGDGNAVTYPIGNLNNFDDEVANTPLWKANLNNIIGTGSSAGAVTALHNAYLTEEMLLEDSSSGKTLRGISNKYVFHNYANTNLAINLFLKAFKSSSRLLTPPSFSPYDLRNYESIPCLDYVLNGTTYNSCDGFVNAKSKKVSTNTKTSLEERNGDLPSFAQYNSAMTNYYRNQTSHPYLLDYNLPPTDPIPNQLRDKLVNFHSKTTRADKTLTFAGAIADKGWVNRSKNEVGSIPVAEIHHINDTAVPADDYYSFSRIDPDLDAIGNKAIIAFYFVKQMAYMSGGISINRELGYDEPRSFGVNDDNPDNLRLLLQDGAEQGGGGPLDVWQHQTQYTYGGVSYGEYDASINAYDQRDVEDGGSNLHQLEKKVMYYANAFLAKGFGTNFNRVDETQTKLNTAEIKPIEEAKASVFTIFPNPTNGNLNVVYEMKQLGAVSVSIYDVTGKEMYNNTFGNVKDGRKTMDLSFVSKKLSSGLYLMKVITPTDTFTAKFLKQ